MKIVTGFVDPPQRQMIETQPPPIETTWGQWFRDSTEAHVGTALVAVVVGTMAILRLKCEYKKRRRR